MFITLTTSQCVTVSTNFVSNCVVENCTRGFWLQSPMNIISNCNGNLQGNDIGIDVYDWGITGGDNMIADNNVISARVTGVRALFGNNQQLTNNVITIVEDSSIQEASGIHLISGSGLNTTVSNNYITTHNSRGGILAENMDNAIISENTIVLDDPNQSTGIIAEGGDNLSILCNAISSDQDNGVSTGISGELNGGHNIASNRVSDLTNGIHIQQGAMLYNIACNTFDGGETGLIVESDQIGIQRDRNNLWLNGGYNTDAQGLGNLFLNQEMTFIVAEPECTDPDDDGYVRYPCNIPPDDAGWFDDSGTILDCDIPTCSNGVGADFSGSSEDQLEDICVQNNIKADSTSCEEQWIADYQLYSLIKSEGIDTLKDIRDYECLAQFLTDIKDSPISTFYTIDSLLTVQDSLLSDSLITTTTALEDALTQEGNRNVDIDGLQVQIGDLLSQLDSLHQYNLSHADSLLTEVGKDSCDIITDWELVYDVLIDEQQGEEVSARQQAELEAIALKCPTQVGHVIYSARRIVSDRTHLRYDLIDDCGRIETQNRSNRQATVEENSIITVPNPASDIVTLKMGKSASGTIVLQSLSGIEVYRSDVTKTNEHVIQTNSLRSGVYIVSFITLDGDIITTKLLIVD